MYMGKYMKLYKRLKPLNYTRQKPPSYFFQMFMALGMYNFGPHASWNESKSEQFWKQDIISFENCKILDIAIIIL